MAKRITTKIKNEIIRSFKEGMDIAQLSKMFSYTENTISKHLKNLLSLEEFKLLKKKNKKNIIVNKEEKVECFTEEVIQSDKLKINKLNIENQKDKEFEINTLAFEEQKIFHEITPLVDNSDFKIQKEISSIPIEDISLPEVVYLIVDKTIELAPKTLKDFPEWGFLSKEDLSRKTLQIFADKKSALRNCRNNEKVLKIPNSKVFILSGKFLINKGISRIVFEENLISI